MGCMSSKLISRSISFKDDLSLKRQGTAKSKAKAMPLLEEMFGSNKGGDQLLALVCTANTVSHKLNSSNVVSLETKASPDEDGNTWDLGSDRIDVPKRSKSWHQFPREEEEEEPSWQSNGVARSRSFHTVEEYDALLEKLRVTGFLQNEIGDDYTVLGIEEEIGSVSEVTDHPLDNEPIEREVTVIEVNSEEEKELLVVEEKDAVKNENKRQAVSKRLESLKIPTMVEFTPIGSLREWLQGGGKVYSPGAYVTPKFGSYSSSDFKAKNKSSEGYVFNPELVTAMEDHMQQLEVEEETILNQIADDWEGKVEEIEKEKCITE